MSAPTQVYPNENGEGFTQPMAGPSNYARQPIPLQPQQQQPYYAGYPQQYPMQQPQLQQQFSPFPPGVQFPPQPLYPAFAHPTTAGVIPNYHFGSMPQPHWQDEWADDQPHDGHEMVYSNLEVKHRRRTTPDQLKILEYWYEINPKPDNALREHLAGQLGMTKRNVQVWFQNRRAKMKGLAKKDEMTADDSMKTPEKAQTVPPRQVFLSPMAPPNMARRASLANGEAAKIQNFVAKRAAAATGQTLHPPGLVSPQRSPLMGQASAARRTSIPYPTPMTAGVPGVNSMSPKISPVVRVMPSALHLTAMRNNTRRASMPGAAQLISSGPFTPPRVVTNQHQVGTTRGNRELSPIKDDHDAHVFYDGDFNTTYITPPSSAYTDMSSFLPTDSTGSSLPFSPNSPLPNPAFSFGDMIAQPPVLDEAEALRQQQLFLAFQHRGRMGSIASTNTYNTDNGNGTDVEDGNIPEWALEDSPDGFEPDSRRSSAPADLLQQINLMGINTNVNPSPIRPSPLGTNFTPESFAPMFDSSVYLTPTDITGSSGPSPNATSSLGSSEGPSPSQHHLSYPQQPSTYQASSVSPYAEHLNHANGINVNQNQTYGQQAYQNAMYDGYQPPSNGIAHPSVQGLNQNQNQNQNQIQGQEQVQGPNLNLNQSQLANGGQRSTSDHALSQEGTDRFDFFVNNHMNPNGLTHGSGSGSGSGSGNEHEDGSKDDFAFLNDIGSNDAVNILA